MITLAVLAALHCDDELALHVRAALRNGLSAEEDPRGAAAHLRLRGRAGGQHRVRDCAARAAGGRRGAMTEAPPRDRQFVQSLERGLSIILALNAPEPQTLSQVARVTRAFSATASTCAVVTRSTGLLPMRGDR
jgi:hypothetical protein